jgi:hypothetical protein
MLFKRICTITVGDPKQNNIMFDQSFRISFNINKNLLSTPKISTVDIYNLTKDSRDRLKEILQKNSSGAGSKSLLTIYAGYEQSEGLQLLYTGYIKHVYNRKEPPDVITTLSCSGFDFDNKYSSISYSGVSTDTMFQDYIKQYGITIDSASDTSNAITLAHGHAHAGLVKDGIDDAAKMTKSTVTVEDNKLKIIPKGKHSKDAIVDVNIENGLIGSPEKIENQGTDADTVKIKDGWKIKTLLQPKIRLGGRINIDSEPIKGIYIADSINHVGDTAHGDWQTIVETKELQT